MKQTWTWLVGVLGSGIAWFFGGWTASLTTLVILQVVDYFAGTTAAGVFHKSKHTESGGLNSSVGWKGLCKKFVVLLFVGVANRIDVEFGTTFIKDAVCLTFITNEAISLIENAGLMGIKIPKIITKAIDVLNGEKTIDELKKPENKTNEE